MSATINYILTKDDVLVKKVDRGDGKVDIRTYNLSNASRTVYSDDRFAMHIDGDLFKESGEAAKQLAKIFYDRFSAKGFLAGLTIDGSPEAKGKDGSDAMPSLMTKEDLKAFLVL